MKEVQGILQSLSEALVPTEEEQACGKKLFQKFCREGILLELSPSERTTPAIVVDFYRRLSLIRSAVSPVQRRRDDRWLYYGDYHFLSVWEQGSFFRTLMIIPQIGADSIILYPVTLASPETPLYTRSHSQLDPALGDPFLEGLGLPLEDQFRLLLWAIHLCGKKAGYYQIPLVDPGAAVIYCRPEMFLWEDRQGKKSGQEVLAELKVLVSQKLEEQGEYSFPDLEKARKKAGLMVVKEGKSVAFDFSQEASVDYFSRIFLAFQQNFPLDFLFLSFSTESREEDIERIYTTLHKAIGYKPYTGWVLGLCEDQAKPTGERSVVLSVKRGEFPPLTEGYVRNWFHILKRIEEDNHEAPLPTSEGVFLDKGSFGSSFSIDRYHFLARFSGVGKFRRPLFTKGELSEKQKNIETCYQNFRKILEKGQLLPLLVEDAFAWWGISYRKETLIALLALDFYRPEDCLGGIRLDYPASLALSGHTRIVDYDFNDSRGSLFLSDVGGIRVYDLPSRGFRLFHLE